MGAGHGHRMHYHGHSVVHRAPAHLKLVALVGFMLVVVATPREWYPVFGGYLLVLLVVVALSGVPAGYLAKRMLIETPFVLFAVAVPFIAEGPRVDVLGLSLSEPGLWAAWGLLAKGTIGVLASLTLAATTEPQDVLVGLRRLRLPDLIVQIMGFMLRYLDVVTAEMGRMTTAMRSRGCDPRSPRHWPVLARSLGALFIRSYERGERVHLAMLARGYDGTLPDLAPAAHGTRRRRCPDGRPGARRPRAGARLPGRHPGAVRCRPARPRGRARRAARTERRRQDHARAAPQRDPHRGRRHRHRLRPCRWRRPTSGRSGVASASSSRIPTTSCSWRRCDRTWPSARRTWACVATSSIAGSWTALEQVGMAEYADRPPHHLSFGQRRRVAVATVLAMEPEILVLDEPSSNLDPASRRELADILRSLDVTVLMVTHDLPYALELCPRSVVLHDGQVVADGATYDLLTDPELMRRHRLELPFGFDPETIPGIGNLPA